MFDTTSPVGFGEAIAFANNFIRVNQSDYGVQSKDLSVVIVVRQHSSGRLDITMQSGPSTERYWRCGSASSIRKTNQAPKVNLYKAADDGAMLANRGTTLDSILNQGVQLAVCQVATRGIAGALAQATGQNTDSVNNELIANIVTNARMVPAGIVAVNRAQERGYSFARS